MSEPLQGTASAANAIARVKYSHDAFIDYIIANPAISQGQLAAHFGYTQAWVSRVMNSDAFLSRLALRKEELVDPVIAASIDEKIRTLASLSLDVVIDKLATTQSAELGMKAFEVSSKALGYGARQANVAVQNNFVVALPPKVADANAWEAAHRPAPVVIDQEDTQ